MLDERNHRLRASLDAQPAMQAPHDVTTSHEPAADPPPPHGDIHMLIVHGSVVARDDTYAEALRLSQEHVARSLQEPGCLHHAVMADLANPRRLVFVEQWASTEDLFRHFKVPASVAFARALAALAVAAPEMTVYEARALPLPPPAGGR
jgi:quinol monooxygenase YgiN